jgi:hypothetical protein
MVVPASIRLAPVAWPPRLTSHGRTQRVVVPAAYPPWIVTVAWSFFAVPVDVLIGDDGAAEIARPLGYAGKVRTAGPAIPIQSAQAFRLKVCSRMGDRPEYANNGGSHLHYRAARTCRASGHPLLLKHLPGCNSA